LSRSDPDLGNTDTEEIVEKTSIIGFIVTLVMLLIAGAVLLIRLLVVEMRDVSEDEDEDENQEETGDTSDTRTSTPGAAGETPKDTSPDANTT
jgi:H+/gluconate symporter-like permease